jgi:hypothetical protein
MDQNGKTVNMDEYEVWSAIDAQRVRTADLLENLTPEEWT